MTEFSHDTNLSG